MDSRNVVLIGFMGTGKTSVGKILARRLGRPVVDIDSRIEQTQKRKISDIFEKDGEAFFRKIEKETIVSVAKEEGLVITTGGGAALDPDNLLALREHGILVSLLASPETIFSRVKHSRHRPLLRTHAVFLEIQKLLEKRAPLYEKADMCFHTDGKTPLQVAELILEKLG
jgi:shikimate kinase